MDPISQILNALRAALPDQFSAAISDAEAALRSRLSGLFDEFEWVPKHEYNAHIELLQTLAAQVGELEQRLNELEATD